MIFLFVQFTIKKEKYCLIRRSTTYNSYLTLESKLIPIDYIAITVKVMIMASTTAEIVAEIAKIKNNHTILNGFENTHHKVHQKENKPSTMGKRKSLYLPRTLPRHANLRRHSALRLEKSAIWLFVSKDKMIVDFLNKKEFFFFRKRPVDFSLNYCTILLTLEHFSKVSIMCITHFETKKNILSKN